VKPGFQNYRYRTSSVGAEFTLNDARSLAASRFDGSAISNVTVKPIKHLNAISQYKIESDALTPDSDVYLAVVSGDLRWPFPAHIASADGKVYVPRGHTAYVLIDPQNARIVAARMLRNQKRPFFVQSR